MLTTVLLSTFLGVAVLQILYYALFGVFAFAKQKVNSGEAIPISVIVCAKNEEKNLKSLIPLLLDQDYPSFELVLINDASNDNTLELIESFQKKHKNIRIVDVKSNENFWGNKKYALTLGIKAAKHEHLLFTDSDCVPSSRQWIKEMAKGFSNKKTIILGYGKYNTVKFSLLNLLVSYETLMTATQYFSYAILGSPYMAVGRNLAYTKAEFFKTKGFINHIQIRSGDDDLFIQEAANKSNTNIVFDPKSFTLSTPPSTYKQWYRQKRRHITTASHYKMGHKFVLGLFYVSKFLFWILFPLLLFLIAPQITLITFGIYLLTTYIIMSTSAVKLEVKRVLWFLPILDVFLVGSQFAIFITNLFYKPTHWN